MLNNRVIIGNIFIDPLPRSIVLDRITTSAVMRVALQVNLINAWSVVQARESKIYQQLFDGRNILNLCDSRWIQIVARLQVSTVMEQIRGADLARELLRSASKTNINVVFLVWNSLEMKSVMLSLIEKFHGLSSNNFVIYDDSQERLYLERIRNLLSKNQASLILVALGSPKQEYVTKEISELFNLPAIGVGAAINFLADNRSEAPKFLQRVGLEWFYRLALEPKRLWRRYLLGNYKFLQIISQK